MGGPWDPKRFNAMKYGGELQKTNYYFTDPSDAYASAGHERVISFLHVPSNSYVTFKAFVTAFNETYTCDWASEQVYGRADPIYMFKQNQRRISLAFKIPAASGGEAYENLGNIQKLTQFLYPSYMDVHQAQTITQSPLIRLKVMNLAAKAADSSQKPLESSSKLFDNYKSTSDPSGGLLGVMNNLTFNHNLETDEGVVEHAPNTILPKVIEVNLDFSVIHEHPVGWQAAGSGLVFGNNMFPYGALTETSEISVKGDPAPEPATVTLTKPGTLLENAMADNMSPLLSINARTYATTGFTGIADIEFETLPSDIEEID